MCTHNYGSYTPDDINSHKIIVYVFAHVVPANDCHKQSVAYKYLCVILSPLHAAQASLERIGVDSKGNMYWYDGGKNMFLSPLSNDTAYKPR